MNYSSTGLVVYEGNRPVAAAVTAIVAQQIAAALNHMAKVREEAERRAEFYRQNPY